MPDALGRPIDGVMYFDPEGLAALLRVTGDIKVEGLDVPIGPENAATSCSATSTSSSHASTSGPTSSSESRDKPSNG